MQNQLNHFLCQQNEFSYKLQDSDQNSLQQSQSEPSQPLNPLINIKIIRWINERQIYEQWYEQFDLSSLLNHSSFDLSNLMRIISQMMNITIDRYQILLFYSFGQVFINFGIYPALECHQLKFQEYCQKGILTIKIKKSKWSLIHLQMGRDMSQYMMNGPPKLLKGESQGAQINLNKKQSCIKNFQKIGYIVKKILSLKSIKRRKRINFDFKNDRKLTTKSVQDYFYQIKQGYKYNFDFNSNSNQNMKVLREYVKEHDEKCKKINEKPQNETNWIEFN